MDTTVSSSMIGDSTKEKTQGRREAKSQGVNLWQGTRTSSYLVAALALVPLRVHLCTGGCDPRGRRKIAGAQGSQVARGDEGG